MTDMADANGQDLPEFLPRKWSPMNVKQNWVFNL